VFYSSLIVYY